MSTDSYRWKQISERNWRLLLGLVVLTSYLLATTGRFRSVDEVSMYVAAVNVVNQGRAHVNQMAYSLWAMRPGEQVTMLGADGDVYTKKSPIVIALMIPFVFLGKAISTLGAMRAALLLGPILTAGTAVLLYTVARQLGYTRSVGSVAAFLFAFCTMALPYAQTVFGELVASLGLLLALWGVGECTKPDQPSASVRSGVLLCGAGVALALGVNAVYVLLIPVFALAIVAAGGSRSLRPRTSRLLWFGVPIGLVGGGLLAYNYARFGTWLETGYHLSPGQEGFTTPLWWGLLGLTVSPARGLLWYSPPVWMALLGWLRFHRAHRLLSLAMLSVIGVHLVAFGTWWEWWGGWGWGPRFLLPIVPYALVACLPLLQAASRGRITARAGVALLALLGLAVQVGGVAIDCNLYEQELDVRFPAPSDGPLRYHHDPGLVYDVARSPILAHWRRLRKGPVQLAWWPGNQTPARPSTIPMTILERQAPGDVIVSLVPELLYELLDQPGLPPVFGLPFNLPDTDALAQTLFARALKGAERVWLITRYGPRDPDNWYEEQLRQEWASVGEEPIDSVRLLLLARPPRASTWTEKRAAFGTIQLAAYKLGTTDDMLFVELAWQATEPIAQSYTTFVHVFDNETKFIVGQDRLPLGGYKLTSSWSPGEPVVDRFAFPLSDAQLAGAQVTVGWYEWPTLERLPVQGECGTSIEESSCLLEAR